MDPREIPQRELRNHISRVLSEVQAGARVRVTVAGRPVADLVPIEDTRAFVARAKVERLLREQPLDEGFLADVGAALPSTVDEL